jgi:hypothetical protein
MHSKLLRLSMLLSAAPALAACSGPGDVTDWTIHESDTLNMSLSHPVTINQIVEDYSGKLETVLTIVHFYRPGSSNLPGDVDHSDPVALVRAHSDIYFMSGWEDQRHDVDPPQATTFNGYSGAYAFINRVDPGAIDLYGAVNIYYYFAFIVHEGRIVRFQIQAREHHGGAQLQAYPEQLIGSLELR